MQKYFLDTSRYRFKKVKRVRFKKKIKVLYIFMWNNWNFPA